MPEPSFLFHDYETFGADPRRDRPSQFAAIRTDVEFNQIGEPEVIYCRQADDYLPHPQACLITGITPQRANRRGLPEAEFAARIQALMSVPGTCSLGYNTLRFDDEVSRHLFYRNLLDPYGREWQNGNSRWDLIDAVRTFYALRPQGIEWPMREDMEGRKVPSFKLEQLTAANGIEHVGAHDALSDVRATISLARLLRERNAKLFDYLLGLRDKHRVKALLDVDSRKPMIHVSRRYPAAQGCSALVAPLARHPSNPNGVIVCDLSADPEPLLALSAEEIRARVFVSRAELAEGLERIPLKVVQVNRSPALLPVKALDESAAARLGIDRERSESHWQRLAQVEGLAAKVAEVFAEPPPEGSTDPDLMLYSGSFFSSSDKRAMAEVHQHLGWDLVGLNPMFQDARLPEMLFRMRARSYPETLEGADREHWDQLRWERFNSPQLSSLTLQGFAREIERLNREPLSERDRQLLEELVMHVEAIMPPQAFE
ncbi:exodeoxyribonuclease I [Halotalea alkalilenta]|uniref:Exodeoxyribonuclease I n=1 Tax=Halotalea alkalilenta TaxID=376489 RepID=A0A172YJ81_9GAMM|nr:exodeoxyribonuclease I [Halotalea alkalilenta]ANF59277.1 exodeoxyribonuclease I [Halotalea alkalilenta]